MLRRMIFQGLIAAVLVASGAAVYAQAQGDAIMASDHRADHDDD